MASQKIPPEIKKRIDYWLFGPFDPKTKAQIRLLQETDPQGLIDAFFSELTFGTGGMRGLMGPGTNRLNIYTIQIATQGLANYLKQSSSIPPLTVLIGFDSRHHSILFAQEAARVLAGNGIQVFLLTALRPTPYISFACRFKHATAAIMITASHNPKEYNGYKVYWSDGAQVVFPHDTGIVTEVEKIREMTQVHLADLDHPLIIKINPEESLDKAYLQAIYPLQHCPKALQPTKEILKIVYTSLHGTGITLAPTALDSWGFHSLHYVEPQIVPSGDFPTVAFPNPEYPETLKMGIETLKTLQGDLLIANDPDADRIGIAILEEGKPVIFNGNELAAICGEYLCSVMTAQHNLPSNGAFITTIVSTELLQAIAASYKIACIEVLTGFKYIGEKIHEWDKTGEHTFLFGAEESLGYLIGTHARDKDAIVASCLFAEIAAYAKQQKKTLKTLLHDIYRKYGIYKERQLSLNFAPGKTGEEQREALMHALRTHPPTQFGGKKVLYTEDYLQRTRTSLPGTPAIPLHLPRSDVLLYRLEDHSKIIIRPSGTEPKVKIYASVQLRDYPSIEEGIQMCNAALTSLLDACQGCTPMSV